jgi:hypothetical protein
MRFRAAIVFFLAGAQWLSLSRADVAGAGSAPPLAPAPDPLQAQLDQNTRTARWMVDYDHVAWATTDLLLKESKETLKRIGPVWFCLEKDGVWYAAYGRYQSEAFEIGCCYRQSAADKFEKVGPPDFAEKDRFARAISQTLPEILELTRRFTVRFNYYVRGEPGRIAIYYVPAFQTDGKLAYGIHHTFFFDAKGERLISHDRCGSVLIGALPNKDRTLTLEMTECPLPTPQAIFTMMTYRDQFAGILTHCQEGYFAVATRDGSLKCIRTTSQPANQTGLSPGSR